MPSILILRSALRAQPRPAPGSPPLSRSTAIAVTGSVKGWAKSLMAVKRLRHQVVATAATAGEAVVAVAVVALVALVAATVAPALIAAYCGVPYRASRPKTFSQLQAT